MAAKKKVVTRKKSSKKTTPRKTPARKKSTAKKVTRTRRTTSTSRSQGLQIGDVVTDFKLPTTQDSPFSLRALRGKNVVLYFYPKDSTPGCTIEGRDFRDRHLIFSSMNTVVLGISRDNLRSHEKFREKENFPFHLLSDEAETACKLFDVIKMKNMYGKMVRGIERSTFLIDTQGKLRQQWRKVKVEGHADEVLAAVKALAD